MSVTILKSLFFYHTKFYYHENRGKLLFSLDNVTEKLKKRKMNNPYRILLV